MTAMLTAEALPVDRALAAQDAPAESVDHAHHRVEGIEQAPLAPESTEVLKPTGET